MKLILQAISQLLDKHGIINRQLKLSIVIRKAALILCISNTSIRIVHYQTLQETILELTDPNFTTELIQAVTNKLK
jgi:hypothetical protein